MNQLPYSDDLQARLRALHPRLTATVGIMAANVLIFVVMLFFGAGWWHLPNGVQLAWGANFGPATQDGEWWRLGSALFLHFGILHLALNMWALWDGGQWVERMLGSGRFLVVYLAAGLLGNLASLVFHQGQVVSGGASGAIFGIYGALLVYIWLHRTDLHPREFRWLFWGALGFSGLTIGFGLLSAGIDNAAHLGGLLAGMLVGGVLMPTGATLRQRAAMAGVVLLALGWLLTHLPVPAYRWSDEKAARQEIREFLQEDQLLTARLNRLLKEGGGQGASFDELAGRISAEIAAPYEQSFAELSALHGNTAMPSASALQQLRQYAGVRRDASRELVEGLRLRDRDKIREALEKAQQSAKPQDKQSPSTASKP